MKKRLIFIFLFTLIFANLIIGSLSAQALPGLTGELDSTTGLPIGATETINKFSDKEARENYLKKEWGKILENNKFFGPIIKVYKKISPVTDPIFKYSVGMKPSLSWLFVLTFTVWFTFLIYLYRIFSTFATFKKGTIFVVSLLFVIIMGLIKIPELFAKGIISLISLLGNQWIQLIVVIIIILGLIIANKFSKQFSEWLKKWKEKKVEEKQKTKDELRRIRAEGATKILETASEKISTVEE